MTFIDDMNTLFQGIKFISPTILSVDIINKNVESLQQNLLDTMRNYAFAPIVIEGNKIAIEELNAIDTSIWDTNIKNIQDQIDALGDPSTFTTSDTEDKYNSLQAQLNQISKPREDHITRLNALKQSLAEAERAQANAKTDIDYLQCGINNFQSLLSKFN